MAKRRSKKRGGSRSKKIPVLATTGAAVFALKGVKAYQETGYNGLMWNTLGVDVAGKFHAAKFLENMAPPAIGAAGSMLAAKMKVNRYISGIPFLKW